jgi:hypothetical protein
LTKWNHYIDWCMVCFFFFLHLTVLQGCLFIIFRIAFVFLVGTYHSKTRLLHCMCLCMDKHLNCH